MSIFALIEADGVTLKLAASTNGGEYGGPCPWCGGFDRFRVWPEEDDGGRYWCRSCGKAGDSIQYLRERRGLSFIDACRYLGCDPGPRSPGERPALAAWAPRAATAPPAAWQERARAFLDGAVAYLWSRYGDEMRRWLRTEKGLSNATIRAAGLGFNRKDIYQSRAAWGLEAAINDKGNARRQWIPAGLVIPHIVDGAIHRLRIRWSDPCDGKRYTVASGSGMAPMAWWQDKRAVAIVESELDGLLLTQEVGDVTAVVALGSAQAKPDVITHATLTAAEVILISLDTDNAGAKAACTFWPATYGAKVKRWPCISGKDPGDARLNGLDLRAWVAAGIFTTEERFERFCIQTIDGGMTDDEAMRTMGAAG